MSSGLPGGSLERAKAMRACGRSASRPRG